MSPAKLIAAPAGQFGPEWMSLLKRARAEKMPDPEHYADAVLRMKEKAAALIASRPALLKTDHKPKPAELASTTSGKPKTKTRATVDASCRCKATTLEGKQCPFKMSSGQFCNKHKII